MSDRYVNIGGELMAEGRKVNYNPKLVGKNLKKMYAACKIYDKLFKGKRYTYYYRVGVKQQKYEVSFFKRNFMHLCGVLRYPGGSKAFYDDCLKQKLNVYKVGIGHPKHFMMKLNTINNLKLMTEASKLGITDGVICYKDRDFGQMLRTRDNLVALGTVQDSVTQDTNVPLSLLNIKMDADELTLLVKNYITIDKLEIIKIADGDDEGGKN